MPIWRYLPELWDVSQKGQQILETLLPAFAYTALSFKEPDKELTAAFKRILESTENQQAITEYISNVNSNLAYTSTVGEIELVTQLASSSIAKEKPVTGTLFMPYSGLLVVKDSLFSFQHQRIQPLYMGL